MIADFRIEVILISSLIGHAADALATGLPTIFVAHDYYPFCPAVVIQFGEVCEQVQTAAIDALFRRKRAESLAFTNVTGTNGSASGNGSSIGQPQANGIRRTIGIGGASIGERYCQQPLTKNALPSFRTGSISHRTNCRRRPPTLNCGW